MTPPPDQASTPAPPSDRSTLATATLPKLEITLQSADILRSLGYPPQVAPPSDVVQTTEELMLEAKSYLQPSGTYSLYAPTNWTDHSVDIGGCTIRGNVGEFSRGANRIAVFIVTVGSGITRQIGIRREDGDAFAGQVLDAIGSWAAEYTAQALITHVAEHLGPDESFTQRFSPGFCGMELSQQRVLFRLAPAAAIGVTLLPSLFMHPMKSVSGFIGLGPRAAVGDHVSTCEPCPLVDCFMRR
jgi:Vitamin B12 dependent methionine synthase, activation domain